MSKPIVAIVGRPNVGKSTLFNKLIGERRSIVEDTPGVTRDRIYAEAEWNSHRFILVDTGGIEPKSDEVIPKQMRNQAEIAIATADVIIFMCDIRSGLLADDRDIAIMLKKSGKPIVVAVNKIDRVGDLPYEFYEFYELGFEREPIALSSLHGTGSGDLLDAVIEECRFDENEQRYMIGITFASRTASLPFGMALQASWTLCVDAGTAVFDALGGLFTDPEIRDQVSGPVGAVAVVADAVQQNGFEAFISLLILISVNLGVMNLLPIPGLDGSRIVFHVIEAIRRKPIKPEREAMVHFIGMIFLLGLMVVFTYKDIVRLLQ